MPKYLALLIGNLSFNDKDSWAPLTSSQRDVESLTKELKSSGWTVAKRFNMTVAQMTNEVKQFAAKIEKDDTALLYVSSHGWRKINAEDSENYEDGYIAGVDTDGKTDNPVLTSASLTSILRKIASKKLVVILDCCHAASIGTPTYKAKDIDFKQPREYLANLPNVGTGRVVIAACRHYESSRSGVNGEPSVFTKHFVAALKGEVVGNNIMSS
jgi:hypothetical protein